MKRCPYCSEEIQDAAKKCRFCVEWIGSKDTLSPKGSTNIQEHLPNSQLFKCKRCYANRKIQWCFFKENVSYFVGRNERTFSGNVCFSCMTKVFSEYTLKTLFGTWWGIIGAFLGPAIIGGNIIEYFKNTFKFIKGKD